jgi:hypothetical protein
MRTHLVIAVIVILAATGAADTVAAGGPNPRDDGGLQGVATPTGFRYVAIGEKNRTILERISPGQHVAALRFLPGRFTIPGVAYDGTTSGLSADGKTLVLIQPRFGSPRERTSFLRLALPGMYVRSAVTLRGDFGFDAISPDGSMLYFIEYLSPNDPTRYAVRAYDVQKGRLLPDPIIDPSEVDDPMRGLPITRATSADGRWAYTLYDGGGEMPFVHALDTVNRWAHCFDLDALAGRSDLFNLRLRVHSGNVTVVRGNEPLALLDTVKFKVRAPQATAVAGTTRNRSPWAFIAAPAAGLLLAAAAIGFVRLRRRHLAPT